MLKIIIKDVLLSTNLYKPIILIIDILPFCTCKKLMSILKKLEDEKNLLKNGYLYKIFYIEPYKSDEIKIAYILNNSLPYSSNGYAIRSHQILKSIQSINMKVYALTRVGFPWDLDENIKTTSLKDIYDEIMYFRLYKKNYHLHDIVFSKYIDNYTEMLVEFMQKNKISIAHAASNYLNGLATIGASKILNIPSIYEVRGFWEITRASREILFKNSVSFKIMKNLEIQACNDATTVIALSEIIKNELITRGIEENKIYVLPNDIDTRKIKPIYKDTLLLSILKIKDKFVIGFIGSVVDYEGLELLVEAAFQIDKIHPNKFRYLIVGDGDDLDNIKYKVQKGNLTHLFVFTGKVAYDKISRYYSIIDAMCYPRLDLEVCRLVSPKKPFEAMAYGIPIISSSVKANSYFIKNGINGLIHKVGCSSDLMLKIIQVYSDKQLRYSLSQNARQWVIKNRDSSLSKIMLKKIYYETQKKFYL